LQLTILFTTLSQTAPAEINRVVLSLLLQTAIESAYNTIYLTGDIDQNALATTPNTRSNGINLSTTAVTNLMWQQYRTRDLTSFKALTLKFAANFTSLLHLTGEQDHQTIMIFM
jgi:hypothetical protein